MIFYFFWRYPNVMLALGSILVFALTVLGLRIFKDKLPADEGRDFAVEGKLSKGKPRGAGIVFIIAFVAGTLLFSPIKLEHIIYILLVFVEMITGYLDDAAKIPWGRLKKGILDLIVALLISITYVYFNGTKVSVGLLNLSFTIPVWLFIILAVLMIWLSINATNCADGVDGLSGTLAIITIMAFYVADIGKDIFYRFTYPMIFFVIAILAYLWFNANPSKLMMGDAGSRAMGVFLSIVALKSGYPFLIIPFMIVILLDGALGLFKVMVIKITKNKNFMSKIRTPLHDHVRKNIEDKWSNPQVVTRFAIIQTVICVVTIFICSR